jgi:hypothetical protein
MYQIQESSRKICHLEPTTRLLLSSATMQFICYFTAKVCYWAPAVLAYTI